MTTEDRGLLLRGVGGSRSSVDLPFALGVVAVSLDMPFDMYTPPSSARVDLLFDVLGGAAKSLVMPWNLNGPMVRSLGMPFSILDATTGVDAQGLIIAPLVGIYEPEPGEVV